MMNNINIRLHVKTKYVTINNVSVKKPKFYLDKFILC